MKDKYTYLNYLDDSIVIINSKGEILFANDRFIDFINISFKELENKNFFELSKERNLNDYATTLK
ncbi:MAG: PAS domain-containing protein, partial [Arcobacter sp.]|nr:PAS domain-containing protein [Arcobacter sp.]